MTENEKGLEMWLRLLTHEAQLVENAERDMHSSDCAVWLSDPEPCDCLTGKDCTDLKASHMEAI